MDTTILAAVIASIATVVAAMLTVILGRKKISLKEDNKLHAAMDAIIELIRANLKSNNEAANQTLKLFQRLVENHSRNFVVAGFYLLKERELIDWEGDIILKPEHMITLTSKMKANKKSGR